jgi:hypothetical protein
MVKIAKTFRLLAAALIVVLVGLIFVLLLSLNPFDKLILKYGGIERLYQEFHQMSYDTLCSAKDGKLLVRRFNNNMSPFYADFFLLNPKSNKVDLYYGYINMKLPYKLPSLQSFTDYFPSKDTINMISNYAKLLWIPDGNKNSNFSASRFQNGYLLRNIYWGDSIVFIGTDTGWVERVLKETKKHYY